MANSDPGAAGALAIYYGGGPGSDPNYDGTPSEAYKWGTRQANDAISDASSRSLTYYVIVLDVEDNGYEGWKQVDTKTSCYTQTGSSPGASLARQTFNGFWDQVDHNSGYWPAVYAGAGTWASIFGTGSNASLTDTMEINAHWGENCRLPAPQGWTQDAGNCSQNQAEFFGGIDTTSGCAIGWQWAAVGAGDFDQVDAGRLIQCA